MKIIHSLYKLSSTSMYILSHITDDNNEFDKKIHKDLILTNGWEKSLKLYDHSQLTDFHSLK